MGDASTAIVKVTPISGCRQDGAPACYLLEIDQAKILLDCGSSASFAVEHLAALRRHARTLDLVLLSHGDMQHCGALPFLLAALNVTCPVLATLPVHHLGLVALYDAFQSYHQAFGRAPPAITLDDIDQAFERITMLRYSQPYTCAAGNAIGIQVLPLAAGHSLGGAMWRIRRHTEEIFYALDFNHKREAHLDGAALDAVQRPSLLIAGARGALDVHVSRKQRDAELVEAVLSSLKAGGTVLLPTDTAARSLELLQVLETHWTHAKLTYPVVFLSHQSQRVLDLAKGMLEWMGHSLTKVFEQDRTNPFDLKAAKAAHTLEHVRAITGPKVVLATTASLDSGMARALLPEILASAPSAIILTTKTEPQSLAASVLALAKGSKVRVEFFDQVPLEGEELERHRQDVREQGEQRAAEEAFAELQRQREQEEEEEEEEEEDDGEEDGGRDGKQDQDRKGGLTLDAMADTNNPRAKRLEMEQINSAAALQHIQWTDYRTDWYVNPGAMPGRLVHTAANSPFYPLIPPDVPLNSDGLPVRYQVFPLREARRAGDDYGEAVEARDFAPRPAARPLAEALVPATAPLAAKIAAAEPAARPMKWVSVVREGAARCTRKFVDFSGICDGRSLKTIYSHIEPRRLVLVGGSVDATEYLYNHFHLTASRGGRAMEVFAPHALETVRVSSASNVTQAVLSDSLIGQIQVQFHGEYELAWIAGAVRTGLAVPTLAGGTPHASDTDVDADQPAPAPERQMVVLEAVEGERDAAVPTLIGSVRLSELRRILQTEHGIRASFADGDLICGTGDRRVAIRRDAETGRLQLEGPVCAEYYSIRAVLYSATAFLH